MAIRVLLKNIPNTYPSQDLVFEHTLVADDYQETLRKIEDRSTFEQIDRIIQFPYTAPVRHSSLKVQTENT